VLLDFDGVSALRGDVLDGGGALQFVPGEGSALDGALQGAEQNEGKDLAIGEALQPHLAEQPSVFAGFGLAALQGEGDRRSEEINHQERDEERSAAAGSWRDRWIPDESVSGRNTRRRRPTNITSMKGETSGSRIWKMRMLGSATNPKAPLRAKTPLCLKTACRIPNDQRKRWRMRALALVGSLGEGERPVFVFHAIAIAQQRHGQIGVFGDGVDMVAARFANRRRYARRRSRPAPRSPRPWC
jgi:hypothetical protein